MPRGLPIYKEQKLMEWVFLIYAWLTPCRVLHRRLIYITPHSRQSFRSGSRPGADRCMGFIYDRFVFTFWRFQPQAKERRAEDGRPSQKMTQTDEHSPSLKAVLSQDPVAQLGSLRAIKDEIIGHPLRKNVYIEQNLLPALLQVLRSASSPPEVRIEATIVLGSLLHGTFISCVLTNRLFAQRGKPCRRYLSSHSYSRSQHLLSTTSYCFPSCPQ